MEIKQWNDIQDKFVDAFGWDNGLRYMTSEARDILKYRSPYELNLREDSMLIKKLRSKYNKEIENNKHK